MTDINSVIEPQSKLERESNKPATRAKAQPYEISCLLGIAVRPQLAVNDIQYFEAFISGGSFNFLHVLVLGEVYQIFAVCSQ